MANSMLFKQSHISILNHKIATDKTPFVFSNKITFKRTITDAYAEIYGTYSKGGMPL
jgi:hypothetical protein